MGEIVENFAKEQIKIRDDEINRYQRMVDELFRLIESKDTCKTQEIMEIIKKYQC